MVTLGVCLMFVALLVKADVFDEISTALRGADSETVGKYFDNNVELRTADKSSTYSKNQAKQVLKQFFTNYPVKSFSLMHKGSSAQGAQYAIGKLETSKGDFRTYMYLKESGGKLYIQQLTFDIQ